ncbi:hypothetical protein N0V93_007589 [Gnomoniopsis smithogilvyi]|uniref:Uncharacterized protein n=1 Tax=Gnomoniopsis smithogilvyi TaxID=1191159 RepID=A0A9W8YSZ3_9PEZI|nr:hypothetical protein N0V93_007589 [Gnomoniopsis smithogilvyi]
MGFFVVGDSEGGSVADRIAIVGVVTLAFSWIPVFVVWKCISVMRRGRNGNENGNTPVTTNNSDPEKQPYHPDPQPQSSVVLNAGNRQHEASRR